MNIRSLGLAGLALAGFATCGIFADDVSAETVTFSYFSVVSEGPATPSGTAPWLTSVFEDQVTPGSVKLTISSNLQNTSEFFKDVHFNLSSGFTLAALTFSNQTKVLGSFDLPVKDSSESPAGQTFGWNFDFETNNSGGGTKRFNQTDVFSVLIAGTGLTASDFKVLSTNNGSKIPQYSVAHVNGLANGASARIGGDLVVVPTPSAAFAGLTLLGGTLLRRRP